MNCASTVILPRPAARIRARDSKTRIKRRVAGTRQRKPTMSVRMPGVIRRAPATRIIMPSTIVGPGICPSASSARICPSAATPWRLASTAPTTPVTRIRSRVAAVPIRRPTSSSTTSSTIGTTVKSRSSFAISTDPRTVSAPPAAAVARLEVSKKRAFRSARPSCVSAQSGCSSPCLNRACHPPPTRISTAARCSSHCPRLPESTFGWEDGARGTT